MATETYTPEELEALFTSDEKKAVRDTLDAIEKLKKSVPNLPSPFRRAILTELSMRLPLMME